MLVFFPLCILFVSLGFTVCGESVLKSGGETGEGAGKTIGLKKEKE